MGLFKKKKEKPISTQTPTPVQTPEPAPDPTPFRPSKYDFEVKTWDKMRKNMFSVLETNPEYEEPKSTAKTVSKYQRFEKPCELVPEPTNPVDENAIMVCYNGVHVGYVPSEETWNVSRLLNQDYTAVLTIRPNCYKKYIYDKWMECSDDMTAFVVMTRSD